MVEKKRSYYRRGKTHLKDSMHSSMMDAIKERAAELEKEGDETKIKDFLNKVFDPEKLQEIADQMASDIIKQSRKDVQKAVELESKQKLDFEKRLRKTHKQLIDSYIELLGVSLEAVENHRKITHENLGEKDTFLPFLLRLHARGVQDGKRNFGTNTIWLWGGRISKVAVNARDGCCTCVCKGARSSDNSIYERP